MDSIELQWESDQTIRAQWKSNGSPMGLVPKPTPAKWSVQSHWTPSEVPVRPWTQELAFKLMSKNENCLHL